MNFLLPGKVVAFIDDSDGGVLRRKGDAQDVILQLWTARVRRDQKLVGR